MMSEKLLTAKEAAEILKVRKNTVYDMIKRGDLKASKLGKQLRIRQGDLEFYIQYGSQAKVYQEGNSEQKNNIEKVEFERNTQNRTEKNVMANPGFGQAGMCDQIIICGQDMVLDLLANRLNQCIGENVFRSYKGSYNALYAMYQGEVNVATAHLWHGKTNSYNIPYISSMLPGTDLVVLHLLKRKQGFYVQKGNPKNIQSFEDLKRSDITIVNREPGSGVRVLIDEKLRQAGIPTQEVNGYQDIVSSHLEAAAAVNRGDADVAVGSEKHSLSVPGIDFLFIQEESYDMVIRKEDFLKKPYQKMIEIIRSSEYQKEVAGLGGYNVENMGKIIYSDLIQ
ncbi:helix-turn-helix transcriptional regulator [Anaerobutyricum soehngenii]|nr:helix-turn-helix transcriptional regulator [Anaerobutyricum soehngenii]